MGLMAAGLAVWAVPGCERAPADQAALREGAKMELKGDWKGRGMGGTGPGTGGAD